MGDLVDFVFEMQPMAVDSVPEDVGCIGITIWSACSRLWPRVFWPLDVTCKRPVADSQQLST